MLTPQRCLIVEDHREAQAWLSDAIALAFSSIDIVTAGSLAEANECLRPTPDLAIVDLGLPDGNGLDLLPELISAGCHVVVATIYSDDQHLFAALAQGAKGYLLKHHSKEELAKMLLGILDGQPPLSPVVAQRLLDHFSDSGADNRKIEEPEDAEQRLTPREREALTLLARGHTARQVGEALGISYHTAAGYVKSIYQKLNVSTRAEAALEADRRGYLAD